MLNDLCEPKTVPYDRLVSREALLSNGNSKKLRSQEWFDNPDDPGMTALYLERYLNYGITREELQSGKPIIGIAQTGSDLSPCNRHHIELAKRVREGIVAAGGIAFEFGCHPIQETGKRPTASLDRNLAYLSLVEVLYGYPLDGVVLTIGCDKTTPALLMAAATVDIPAIALSVGPMLNGWHRGERTGSGTIVWKARELLAAGDIDYDGFMELVASSAPSVGYCNTMGTATTMNSLAEALGMQLPGSAAIPAPYRERGQMAYATGRRAVEMVHEDLKPTDIMTRAAFENAIVVNSAIGGSTNAPIHLNAIARHLGVPLNNDDWQSVGHHVPLLVNLQPAGEYLGEDYHRAGGVPAVVAELMRANLLPHPDVVTANGRTMRENCAEAENLNQDVIRPVSEPHARECRLHQPARQSVRFSHHEDQCHLAGIPRPLPLQSRRSGCLRGQGDRLRRAGRLSCTVSRTRRWASTRTACWSSAAPARSVIRARPRW
jgi:dihydroxy-acid dehydratase